MSRAVVNRMRMRIEMESKFLVCRINQSTPTKIPEEDGLNYEIHQIFSGETWIEEVDQMDGSIVTIIKKDGHTVNTAGEPCGEFETIGEARIHCNRLEKILVVMET